MRSFYIALILLAVFFVNGFCADVIVLKTGVRIEGKVIKRTRDKWAFRRVDGSLTILETKQIAEYIQGNKIYDIQKKVYFVVEKRRPYLPFLILSAGTGYYAVKKFQDYKVSKKKAADDKIEAELSPDYTNIKDNSGKDLAYGIVSGIFCVGSFYFALKPVEVKTAMGSFRLTMTPARVNLALSF